jgi:corrinoid protein of di/trimethylamine methyltransferase
MSSLENDLEQLKKAIIEGDPDLAEQLAKKILESKIDPLKAIYESVVPGILKAGELWEQNIYFIPDVIMSAEAFKSAMSILEKNISISTIENKSIGKYLICTVEGDIHDLGKSIVVTMLKAAGFIVYDLGIDVPIKKFIEKVKELKPDIVGLGAYMSTTAVTLKDYIQALKNEGLRDKVKVMIGGVRISQEYANNIGADAWASIPNVNKEILEKFVFPYNRMLKEKTKKKGITAVVAVTADYCVEDPEKFDPELMKWCWYHGSKALFGRPGVSMGMGKPELWPMDVIKEFIKENTSMFWKPPVIASCSASFIRDSSPYEIANYVKRIIDNLGRDGHLSFFLIQIPADTPPINVHSFVNASKIYGKYPIIENLDEIEFKLPEFKSYEEWYREEASKGRAIEYE